jgi:digeranylgeranylglycerophospholipid reductase
MAIECDVLVVGAGPAGSSAARAAALGGAKTIFIDKKTEVGAPVQYTECVSGFLLPFLPIKVPQNQFRWKIEGIRFWADRITVDRVGALWEGYSVDRNHFDKWLSQEAVAGGASLRLDTELVDLEFDGSGNVKKAVIKTGGSVEEIMPKVLVAADGVKSTTLNLLGEYKPQMGDVAEVYSWEMRNLDLRSPNMKQIFFGDFTPGGYAYIFPRSKTVANVGVCGLMREKEIQKHFFEFLDVDLVKRQVKDAEYSLEKTKDAVWGNLSGKKVYGNVLFAGDAANHNLKPFIEGILPSMVSGNLCGELGVKMLAGATFESEYYEKEIEKVLHPHFVASKFMEKRIQNWFKSKHSGKNLLFAGLATGLFEVDKLDELEAMSYDVLRTTLLRNKNMM